ncbi:MAG: hypothetical protein CMP33_03950 [Rickettsiales bacterium]|nr:hypothetical protein [Rickettsiales bacterium]
MPYTILCFDKENKLNVRKMNRDEHLKYLKSFKKKLLVAGPILDKNSLPSGSIIVLDLDTKQEIKEFIKNDPYNKAGLFRETKILNFKKVF